jgi:hypothetical protein
LLVGSTQLIPQLSGVLGGHIVVQAKPPSSPGPQRSASAPHALPHAPQFSAVEGSTHPASPHSIAFGPHPASAASSPPSPPSPSASSEASIIDPSSESVASDGWTEEPSGRCPLPPSQFSVQTPSFNPLNPEIRPHAPNATARPAAPTTRAIFRTLESCAMRASRSSVVALAG